MPRVSAAGQVDIFEDQGRKTIETALLAREHAWHMGKEASHQLVLDRCTVVGVFAVFPIGPVTGIDLKSDQRLRLAFLHRDAAQGGGVWAVGNDTDTLELSEACAFQQVADYGVGILVGLNVTVINCGRREKLEVLEMLLGLPELLDDVNRQWSMRGGPGSG